MKLFLNEGSAERHAILHKLNPYKVLHIPPLQPNLLKCHLLFEDSEEIARFDRLNNANTIQAKKDTLCFLLEQYNSLPFSDMVEVLPIIPSGVITIHEDARVSVKLRVITIKLAIECLYLLMDILGKVTGSRYSFDSQRKVAEEARELIRGL